MVQFRMYSSAAKAVSCAALTACHSKVKVWYLCYTGLSLPMECWLKKASLNTASIEPCQQRSIALIFSSVHCPEHGLPREVTRDALISQQSIYAVHVERQS